MNEQVIPVSGNQKIAFQCQRCSACCRHVENKVMLNHTTFISLRFIFKARGNPSGQRISVRSTHTPCRWNRIFRFFC